MPNPKKPQSGDEPTEKPVIDSQIFRQWKLMEWLTTESEGITVAEAAEAFDVNLRTIRRDLILLRHVGFDLVCTDEEHNRKRWRIRQPWERLRTKRQRYAAIRDQLTAVCSQAQVIGDQRLVEDLENLLSRVKRRCGN